MAERWKVSQGSVSVWLAGKGIPDREQIKRIAADCRVDPGWLDYGTEPAEPSTHVRELAEEAEENA
jgi:transcriptional regulator with XRE-family HTH domain